MKIDKIEKNALLWLGVVGNFIMACSGWYVYHLTSSSAVLLDGNFSFVAVLTSIVAIIISSSKSKRTEVFPFGLFVFESLYSFCKALLLLGVTLMAGVSNIEKIIRYLLGYQVEQIQVGPILVYGICMSILCFSIFCAYHFMNKKINNQSMLLKAEKMNSLIDGLMSLGVGLAFFLISLVSKNGDFGFLWFIGDSLMVIVLILLAIKMPLKLLKTSFIELLGGTLQDKDEKQYILDCIHKVVDLKFSIDSQFILKSGSQYIVLLRLKSQTNQVNVSDLSKIKEKIYTFIVKKFNYVEIEVTLVQ